MKTKIMILGGGENQLPLIIKARELGFYTVVCDYAESCPGFKYADRKCLVSIKDQEALLKVAVEEKVSGIATNSEPVLHIVTQLTEQLGLPSVPFEVMERFRNKFKMRECLTPLGLSDVAYGLCHRKEEALAFFHDNGRQKCIMKPLDNSSSRGVYSVLSEGDIDAYFDEAIGANRICSGVLLEHYIEGTEFTVDGISLNGKHTTLAISRKKHFPYNENVANELYFSYSDPEFDYDEMRSLNNRIVEAAGLNFGLTHAEYKYSNGKFHLIEVAARGGGAFISTDIVPFLTEADTVGAYLKSAMGLYSGTTICVPESSRKRAAVLKFFSTPGDASGVVKELFGIDFLKNDPRILRFDLAFKVGDHIRPAANDSERIGHYIAVSEDEGELRRLMKEIENRFEIVFEE